MSRELDKKLASKLVAMARQLESLAREILGEMTVSPAVQERFDRFRTANVCLHCGENLGGERDKRGLHASCYVTLMQRISRGKATEIELIEEGRMRPAESGGRRSKDFSLPELTDSQAVIVDREVKAAIHIAASASKRTKSVKPSKLSSKEHPVKERPKLK